MGAPKTHKKISKRNRTIYSRRTIKYLVIHYVGAVSTAKNNAAYFYSAYRGASAHYFTDDTSIWQAVEDKNAAWHCGGGLQGSGGHSFFKKCTNANSIGIEMCCKSKNGRLYITEQTIAQTAKLVQYLQDKYDIPDSRVIRHYDVTGKTCLPIDTSELLTPYGYKLLSEISVGDSVAQYVEPGKIEFAPVMRVVEPYESEVISCIGIEATKDHRMWSRPNCINSKEYRFKEWGDFFIGSVQNKIKTCGQIDANGINLTDDEIRYLVWVQGDGSYMKNCKGVEFHFSKKRKIERLTDLLESLEKRYTVSKKSDGTTAIRLYGQEEIDEVEGEYLNNKIFTWNWLNMSKSQADVFKNELIHVDGSIENNSYFSMVKQNADVVQAVMSINNIRAYRYKDKNNLYVISFKDDCLERTIIAAKTPHTTRTTTVSCVTVPSGLILIRQNGRVSVVGNCPGPYINNEKWAKLKKTLTASSIDPKPDDGKLEIDGSWGKDCTRKSQKVFQTTMGGIVSNQPVSNKKYLPNAYSGSWEFTSNCEGGSALIKAIQKLVGAKQDGWCGKATVKAIQKFLKAKKFYGGKIDGSMGPATVKAWQKYINSRL